MFGAIFCARSRVCPRLVPAQQGNSGGAARRTRPCAIDRDPWCNMRARGSETLPEQAEFKLYCSDVEPEVTAMTHILAMTLVLLLTLGGMFSAGVAFGETGHGAGHHERHMQRGGHPGAGGRHQEHHSEHHGRDGDQGHCEARGESMGKELLARHWQRTLTPEQRTQVDQLQVTHAKANAPLRAKMDSIKMDLAVLATAEEPDTAAIQQHIDELLELEKKVMQQRYTHIAAVRQALTPEQRTSYDMMALKHAKKRKRGGHW